MPTSSQPDTAAVQGTAARRRPAPAPFLKWAGGKRQLLPDLRRYYPSEFGTYFEPFVGSGAVFFDLNRLGLLRPKHVVLADTNADIVGVYRAIRNHVSDVIAELEALAEEHGQRGNDCYYDVRDRRFNPVRARLRGSGHPHGYSPALAAALIYLNRTGFNGLFRLNADGDYNVPAGRYTRPRIVDADNLRAVAAALASLEVSVAHRSFEAVRDQAQRRDFVYFDPPYAPLSPTASFTSYTAGGFADEDQLRLQQVVVELAERGCHVLLSNSTAPIVRQLYAEDSRARRAGLAANVVRARRAINSRVSARGPVHEYVITNMATG